MGRKIVVSVISDLVTDQRVMKECNTLYQMGYEVTLVGRKSNLSSGLDIRPYRVVRLDPGFKRGMQMYIVFNLQLLFFLLFNKADILWSNDLDTLLPNFLISRLKGVKLIYDSHEYFTMSVVKMRSRRIWERLEKWIFPNLRNVITVNESIKDVYETKYRVPLMVLRNVPYKSDIEPLIETGEEKILIIQGVGINENRGAEEAVEMMQYLPQRFVLYFIGRGTVFSKLKGMVKNLKLSNQVVFIDPLPYGEMMVYTRKSFLGLILEKIDVTDEHMFALPNRFFDYIKAGIPVLSTAAVEIKFLVNQYKIGRIAATMEPELLAKEILNIEKDPSTYMQWKQNTMQAAQDLCWEKEEEKLKDFMNHLS